MPVGPLCRFFCPTFPRLSRPSGSTFVITSFTKPRETEVFWHQSEARTAATVWNWSGKTLSPGALLAVLYFSSCHIFFRPFRLFLVPTISPWVSEDGPAVFIYNNLFNASFVFVFRAYNGNFNNHILQILGTNRTTLMYQELLMNVFW